MHHAGVFYSPYALEGVLYDFIFYVIFKVQSSESFVCQSRKEVCILCQSARKEAWSFTPRKRHRPLSLT